MLGVERFRWKTNAIKLKQRLYTQPHIRLDDCVHADSTSRTVIKLPELHAQIAEYLTTAAAMNRCLKPSEVVVSAWNDSVLDRKHFRPDTPLYAWLGNLSDLRFQVRIHCL